MNSPNGRYHLQLQDDGNLVIYRNDGVATWASGPDENPPVPPVGGPLPTLRTSGTRFLDQSTGQPWKWRGVSAFRLFDEYQLGHDISGYCGWAVQNKLNLLRVFGMYCGKLGRLVPYEVVDYFGKVDAFVEAVGQYGLTVEWTAFADMQTAALSRVDKQGHYAALMDIFLGRAGIILECVNEPFVNGMEPEEVYAPFGELAQALGKYVPENGQLPHAQYLTIHDPRDDEWPRRAKNILELTRLGWDGYPALNIPGIGDEPMGIGVDEYGRRSMNAHDHAAYHATAHLFGSGSTIHSDFGIECRLPRPDEQAVVDAITSSWSVVPEDAQLWQYTAGHLSTCPLEQDGLRIFGMINGNTAVCVLIRPTHGPVPRAGWRVVTQQGYGGLVVTLER